MFGDNVTWYSSFYIVMEEVHQIKFAAKDSRILTSIGDWQIVSFGCVYDFDVSEDGVTKLYQLLFSLFSKCDHGMVINFYDDKKDIW